MTDPNDAAFPEQGNARDPRADGFVHIRGMTKREEFAKAAMQGLLSNGNLCVNIPSAEDFAEWALEQADAMIEQLNKEQKPWDEK